MKRSLQYFTFCVFCVNLLFAQKEANNWYFGRNCGVTFSSGKPMAITDGLLSTEEGCVTISDNQGKILFYTEGVNVWDKNHQVMKGGTKLFGSSSATQSGVVIRKPNSNNEFYLFTVDETAKANGLCYTLIDLNKNNGLGEIDTTKKNIQLKTPVTEKLTAVLHRNNRDMWVIAHEWKSKKFIAYLVKPDGINPIPVVSETGYLHDGNGTNTQGYMKANPDGTNLAVAIEDSCKLEILDFDNATGKISNPVLLNFPPKLYLYGVEFSPDGSVLYCSAAGTGEIYQINLQAGSEAGIKKSITMIGKSENKEWIGALQIATDGKIYFPVYGKSFLGAINNPNELGSNCDFKLNVVDLAGKITSLGLPTFAQNFFKQDQTVKNLKYFDEKSVSIKDKIILKNIRFDFGKYVIKPISFPELDLVVKILKQKPTYFIDLNGHTDNIGNKSDNIILSFNRAKAIKDYLIKKGIAEKRISYFGYGSSKPVANNDSEEGKAKNRRVDFSLSLEPVIRN